MSDKHKKTKQVYVRLDDEMFNAATIKAKETHRTKGQLIEHAISYYLEKFPPKEMQ